MRNRICIWQRYRVADERYLSVDREQFFLPISWLSVFIPPSPVRHTSLHSISSPPPSLIASFARKSFDLFARVKATPFFDPARTSRTKEIRLKEKKKEREEKRHYKVGKEGERFAVANNVAQPWKRGARAAAF